MKCARLLSLTCCAAIITLIAAMVPSSPAQDDRPFKASSLELEEKGDQGEDDLHDIFTLPTRSSIDLFCICELAAATRVSTSASESAERHLRGPPLK